MPRPDRDTEHESHGYPAGHHQLGEILPGYLGGERRRPPRPGPWRADGGADGRELRPAQRERPPGQPDSPHPVPAQLGTLGDHPAYRRLPRQLHRLHQRPERPRAGVPAGGPGAVDRRPEHLADWFKAHTADGRKLVRGQRGPPRTAGPQARYPGFGHRRKTLAHVPSLGSVKTDRAPVTVRWIRQTEHGPLSLPLFRRPRRQLSMPQPSTNPSATTSR